jgi:hypothetical protein
MYGLIHLWMDTCTDARVYAWIEGHLFLDVWMYGFMGMDVWMNGFMDIGVWARGCIDRKIYACEGECMNVWMIYMHV